jgi:hypothetical protein
MQGIDHQECTYLPRGLGRYSESERFLTPLREFHLLFFYFLYFIRHFFICRSRNRSSKFLHLFKCYMIEQICIFVIKICMKILIQVYWRSIETTVSICQKSSKCKFRFCHVFLVFRELTLYMSGLILNTT